MTEEGGLVLDWHTCDAFPERWVDLVVVLRCDHTLLWERLEKRYVRHSIQGNSRRTGRFDLSGYPLKKIQENNESEIMQTVLEDAKESYAEEIVIELRSESVEDMESNVSRIVLWIENWRRDRGFAGEGGSS
jgi:adenylate kinase